MDAKKVAVCGLIIGVAMKRRRRRRRNRTVWTRDWIKNRMKQGAYHQLLQELRLTDKPSYQHFLRMDIESFEEILEVISPLIQKQDTCMRQAIPPAERLALTLRFIATGNKSRISVNILNHLINVGESYTSLQYIYRIPAQTIGKIVPETCQAIVQALQHHIQVNMMFSIITIDSILNTCT